MTLLYKRYSYLENFFGSPEFKVDDKGSNRVVSEILVDTKKINKLKKEKKIERGITNRFIMFQKLTENI